MKTFYTFLLLVAFAMYGSAQSNIVSITVNPANPTTHDTVLVIVNTLFPSGDCPLDYKSHTQTEYSIQAITHHCLGMLAVMCGAVDTFEIGTLSQGTYTFHVTLTSGGLPIPCTPGIVIDDEDSTTFTVIHPTGIEDPSRILFSFENPVSDILRFNAPLPERAFIFSITGQMVKVVETGKTEVTVSELQAGLYFIHIKGVSRKLVVK